MTAACVPLFVHILRVDLPIPAANIESTLALGLIALALIAVFVWCELFPLRVEFRTETFMIGLFEFPLLIGLLIAPWWLVLGSQLVAGVGVFVVRRDQLQHSMLNTALVFVDCGVAVNVIILLDNMRGADSQVPISLIVAAGVFVGSFASTFVISIVIRLIGASQRLLTTLIRSGASAAIVIVFALVEYRLWLASPTGPYLAVSLIGVFIVIYLTFRNMVSRHSNLNQLYTFIRAIGDVQADFNRWPDLMEMVRAHNNASTAVLLLDEPSDFLDRNVSGRMIALAIDSTGELRVPPVNPDDPLLALARERGAIRVSADKNSDPDIRHALATRNARAVMVVALSGGGRVHGYVEVRDRLSRWGEFTDEDQEFLSTLAVHMGTALENIHLLGNLRNEAYRDSVTGLRSRAGLAVDAQKALERGRLGALALIDLDILTQVNSALGYRHGEELLVLAGERIIEAGPAGRTVARLESDLFAIMLEPSSEEQLSSVMTDILRAVSAPFSLAGVDVEAEPRAGVAVVGDHDAGRTDSTVLLQRAEMALLVSYNRNAPFEVFRPSMGEAHRRRFQLVTQFRQALEQGQIAVHYQPKLTLKNQELRGAEALVRWNHPEFGVITPAEFVPAIEETGSIDMLLDYVLRVVLQQIRQWLDRNLEIPVAINLSVRNLTARMFPERVAEQLREFDVPARLVTFEITESNVMDDPETALPILGELHAMGLSLAVDDFGTGYSSLAYLRRLPINEIKIDRSFVLGMSTALGDLAIVRSIIDLGHSLGLQVIAEGVEEESSREALRSMGCDGIQGFLISRPQPVDRFEQWLQARTVRSTVAGSTRPALRVDG